MKKIISYCLVFFTTMSMHAQLNVDLTTGKDDITGLQIPVTNQDDSWQLLTTSGYVYPYTTDGIWMNFTNPIQLWAPNASCGMWIGSTVSGTTGHLTSNPQNAWTDEYKLDFMNSSGCGLTNARIEINTIGVDNSLYFELNGNTSAQYQVNTAIGNCAFAQDNFSVLTTTPITIPINPAYLLPGANTIRVFVCNNDRHTGFYLCAALKADFLPDPNLIPTITGSSSFCSGSPVIVNGSSATTSVTNYYWEMAESDAAGNVTPGGYLWSGWYSGVPSGNFSIPNSNTAPCGKYYKIKLALQNACSVWAETNKVVYINCSPAPVISGPSALCYGQSGNYSSGIGPRGSTFSWSNGGTGPSITYAPTSSTVLTVTVTSIYTGCSGTASFPITVYNTNSDFIPTATLFGNYFTVSAAPVVTTGLPPGFSFAWIVEEVGPPPTYVSVPNTLVNNPAIGCWWTMSCNFTGYNGTSTYPSTCPSGNPPGQFTSGHYYRITRGTWSTNCGWQQTSKIVFLCNNCRSANPFVVVDDNSAPSFENTTAVRELQSEELNKFLILPNPNNGTFTIQLDKSVETGTVEVYNLMGEKVSAEVISNSTSVSISNSGLAKGIYLVKINTDTEAMSQRMIIE